MTDLASDWAADHAARGHSDLAARQLGALFGTSHSRGATLLRRTRGNGEALNRLVNVSRRRSETTGHSLALTAGLISRGLPPDTDPRHLQLHGAASVGDPLRVVGATTGDGLPPGTRQMRWDGASTTASADVVLPMMLNHDQVVGEIDAFTIRAGGLIDFYGRCTDLDALESIAYGEIGGCSTGVLHAASRSSGANVTELTGVQLQEISVVDRPAIDGTTVEFGPRPAGAIGIGHLAKHLAAWPQPISPVIPARGARRQSAQTPEQRRRELLDYASRHGLRNFDIGGISYRGGTGKFAVR